MITGDIMVLAEWLPRGGFFVWGEQQIKGQVYQFGVTDLKFCLFAWHRPSFYGSFIETIQHKNWTGIYLSPRQALDFFAEPPYIRAVNWQWSEEIIRLREYAPVIKEILAEGRWRPDFAGWQADRRGWRLDWPSDLETGANLPYLSDWTDGIINELIEQNQQVRKCWDELAGQYPLLQSGSNRPPVISDEEEWLEAIGWKRDLTPFRTCLQIIEPSENTPWQLNILLQDQQDPSRLVVWGPAQLEEGTDFQAGEKMPPEWIPHLGRIHQDTKKWIKLIPWLADQKGRSTGIPDRLRTALTEDEAWEFLNSDSLKLAEAGCTVFLPKWWEEIQNLKPKLKIFTRSSIGARHERWLGVEQLVQFDWKLSLGDIELSEHEFRQIAKKNQRLTHIQGKWVKLDPAFLQEVLRFIRKKKTLSLGEALQMYFLSSIPSDGEQPSDFPVMDTGEDTVPVQVELNKQLASMAEQLANVSAIPVEENFPSFRGTLRPYQRAGASWLLFLRRFGLGGCLADDMGLGKTVQWIAYLLKTREENRRLGIKDNPSLLICPTSVLGNWQKELERFSPGLRVYLHYGSQRKKGEAFISSVKGADLVMTTYNLAHLDEEDLRTVEWDCIGLDEAQNIKNAYTKQSMAVRSFEGRHRVALTGTPMENRLTELWSIMNFLNPGYLGSIGQFKTRFVNVIERQREEKDIRRVQRLIAPFLLRRVKSDPAIELDLPEKQERKEYIPLTVEQASLYESILQNMLERLDKTTGMERRGLILSTLTKLKQACNHPALLLKETLPVKPRERSNKVQRLLEMVEELRKEGDRCLIFTQFLGMGQMLQQIIEKELRERVFFLHGGTPRVQRDEMIARFQERSLVGKEACNIFILSLKAGGLGLNLTAANHVFHFDRWWNPAVENQATDRSHRIGQQRMVQVHKFISPGTLEERIDEMIEQKQDLNQQIVCGGETWITELSTKEIREIFALRKEWIGA